MAVYCDGGKGWIATPQGLRLLAGPPLQQAQGELLRVWYLLLLSDRLPGRKVNRVDEFVLEISDASGSVRLTLDPETLLPRQVAYPAVLTSGPPQTITETFSDYREVEGVQVPHRSVTTQGGKKYAELTLKEYKLNTGLTVEEISKRP